MAELTRKQKWITDIITVIVSIIIWIWFHNLNNNDSVTDNDQQNSQTYKELPVSKTPEQEYIAPRNYREIETDNSDLLEWEDKVLEKNPNLEQYMIDHDIIDVEIGIIEMEEDLGEGVDY